MDMDIHGWIETEPMGDGDCRKLVTLEDRSGMIWVGIRAWSADRWCWMNNGVREESKVLAWQDLPPPIRSDGLMTARSIPTL